MSTADGLSRRAALAAGGAGITGLLVAGCGTGSEGKIADSKGAGSRRQTLTGDLAVVQFALTLELVERDFYRRALADADLSRPVRSLFRAFSRHERVHADTLTALNGQLGGSPIEAPETRFDLTSERRVLRQALDLERTGGQAYLGQATEIDDRDLLAAALSIHSVEWRHAAAIAELLGEEDAVPDGAFAKPLTRPQVEAAIKPFLAVR